MTSCCAVYCHYRFRSMTGNIKRNEGGYSCNTSRYNRCRRCIVILVGSCHWGCGNESRKPDNVGYQLAAFPYGNYSFSAGRYRSDPAHLLCCNMCSIGTHRPGRRSCSRRLLCSDGRLRCDVLQGKSLGWSYIAGNRNFHASDGQYYQKSTYMDCANCHICYHRASRHLRFSSADEWNSCFIRNGYMWSCGTDRCIYRMGQ